MKTYFDFFILKMLSRLFWISSNYLNYFIFVYIILECIRDSCVCLGRSMRQFLFCIQKLNMVRRAVCWCWEGKIMDYARLSSVHWHSHHVQNWKYFIYILFLVWMEVRIYQWKGLSNELKAEVEAIILKRSWLSDMENFPDAMSSSRWGYFTGCSIS